MNISALADATSAPTTNLALLPGFLDPVTLLGYFGTWALVGLLAVILIESGVLFPVLPGDSLLFVAGLVAASQSTEVKPFAPLWVLLVTIPIAAVIGGQIGYWIGRYAGTAMFTTDSKILKKRYVDEAHEFFEQRGPVTIFLARFVPIVRTLAPLVAGAARMNYLLFTIYNVVGAIVWGVGITLLGYWLGRIEIIQKLIEPIFILIVLISVIPIFWEYLKRRRAARAAGVGPAPTPRD